MDEIKIKAEQLANDMAAAKAEAASAKAEAAALKAEVEQKGADLEAAKTSIDNLDASVKEQAKTIEMLRVELSERPTTFRKEFRKAFDAVKDDIVKLVNEKKDKFEITLELKSVTPVTASGITGSDYVSVQADPTVHGAPHSNVFIMAFGIRPPSVKAKGDTVGGITGTKNNATSGTSKLESFAEKTRAYGKIATFMAISTEVEDWLQQIYNYCVNEGVRLIEDKLDAEIAGGAGSDATYPYKIYGIKGAATAFSALAAGAVTAANVADVILDAADQVAKNGFTPNVAFLTWADYRKLRNLKDSTGNYLFDQVNGILGGLRVYPTAHLSAGEVIVADSTCVEIYAGNSYELEFDRNAAYDGYNVYFRKAAQVKIPAAKAKGVIYVASVTTAIAALTPSS